MNWPLLLACPVLHVQALNIYLAGGWKISGLNQIILWVGFDLLNVRLSKLSLVPASAENLGCICYEEEKKLLSDTMQDFLYHPKKTIMIPSLWQKKKKSDAGRTVSSLVSFIRAKLIILDC